jgi:hypothetical protein
MDFVSVLFLTLIPVLSGLGQPIIPGTTDILGAGKADYAQYPNGCTDH